MKGEEGAGPGLQISPLVKQPLRHAHVSGEANRPFLRPKKTLEFLEKNGQESEYKIKKNYIYMSIGFKGIQWGTLFSPENVENHAKKAFGAKKGHSRISIISH